MNATNATTRPAPVRLSYQRLLEILNQVSEADGHYVLMFLQSNDRKTREVLRKAGEERDELLKMRLKLEEKRDRCRVREANLDRREAELESQAEALDRKRAALGRQETRTWLKLKQLNERVGVLLETGRAAPLEGLLREVLDLLKEKDA